jgi:hypothetical protein
MELDEILGIVCGILLLALIIGGGIEQYRVKDRDETIAKMTAADAQAKAQFLADSKTQQEKYDALEAKAAADYAAQKAASDADAARLIAAGNGLQHTIDVYAASNRCNVPGSKETGPVADGPAVTLGKLLEACLSVAGSSAASAEALADQVRGLQASVP